MCVRCGAEKPLSDYYAKDRTCKECRKAAVRKNRLEKVDYYREYDRDRNMREDRVQARKDYIQTDAGKESRSKTVLKYRKENPTKRAAHNAVNNAVRDGYLTKESACSECGSSDRVEAHHDDYSRQLEVRWLCCKCHNDWHNIHGEALNG